jgi:protein-S-isoprenylcysteine O-methyltransferase Ste14
MKSAIYIITLIGWLLISRIVFQKVRGDYKKYGKLTKFSSSLQILIFVLHAQLFTLSYWDLSIFPSDKYLSVYYWFKTAPEWSGSIFSLLTGSCLAAVGILILGFGFKGLDSFERANGRRVDALMTKGIYRITRNPQLVGYGLIVLSVPFFWNSIFAVIAALIYWFGIKMMVTVEEEHLHRVFGEDYDEYCKITPRYLICFR